MHSRGWSAPLFPTVRFVLCELLPARSAVACRRPYQLSQPPADPRVMGYVTDRGRRDPSPGGAGVGRYAMAAPLLL